MSFKTQAVHKASIEKRTTDTPTHKSKRARRAENQDPYNESSDSGSESEEVVVVIVKRMNGHLKGRLNAKVLGRKEEALAHVGQERK